MKKVTINLFSVSELNKEAKIIAIDEHKEFLLSVFDSSDYEEIKYTYSQYKRDLKQSDILESIEINNYLFYSDGYGSHFTLYERQCL